MTSTHLTNADIDSILDQDPGEDAQVAERHVLDCASCRARLDEARRLVRLLEEAPRLAPSLRFADAVMRDVSVIVPLHVAVRDTVRSLMPRSRVARTAALAGVVATGGTLTVGAAWVLARPDVIDLATDAASDRLRQSVGSAASGLTNWIVGSTGATPATGGMSTGMISALLVVAGASAAGLFGLRALSLVARRRRM